MACLLNQRTLVCLAVCAMLMCMAAQQAAAGPLRGSGIVARKLGDCQWTRRGDCEACPSGWAHFCCYDANNCKAGTNGVGNSKQCCSQNYGDKFATKWCTPSISGCRR